MRFVTVLILSGTCGRYAKPEERSLFSSKTGHSTRGPGVLICTGHIHCRYVPPQRVGFLRRFGTKNGYRLCPLGSEIGYDSRENSKECMNLFIVSIDHEVERKTREICEIFLLLF